MPKRDRTDDATVTELNRAWEQLDEELQRSRCAYHMSKKLHALCEEAGIDSMSIFVGFVFETIAQRTVYEAAYPPASHSSRTWLHHTIDTDRGVSVRLKSDPKVVGTLSSVTFSKGTILACVETADATMQHHPLDAWEAAVPIPLYLDPMLPCGEVVLRHKSPMSVFQLCLSKLCDADKSKSKTFNVKKRVAWGIADRAARLAFEAREDYWNTEKGSIPRKVLVSHRLDAASQENEIALTLCAATHKESFAFETEHRLVEWQYQKLRRFYHQRHHAFTEGCEVDEAVFHLRLFSMLQRYTGVTGLFSRIEAGWHAAVPPEPFDYLRSEMNAEAEGFASPLNARMTTFCSAFFDTDHFFGSQGPFHRFFPRHGCFEVGPPYDHEVIRIAFAHAIDCLAAPQCDGPLCFVFIVPDSQRDAGLSVRELVEKCPFKKISEIIPRREAKYIDGFQHRPGENRLITISCDTRIIILQNDDAARKWPAAHHFAELRNRWVRCTSTIDTNANGGVVAVSK